MNKKPKKSPPVPPQTNFVKILHGLIIISLFIMIGSGLQIYNATPVFGGKGGWSFPKWATLGGWLAGGRNWHFAAMWVFAFTLLIYGIYIFLTKRWKRKFVSEQDLKALKVGQNPKRRTYAWHRIIYTGIIPVLLLSIASGLAMYKPAQLHWLAGLFINWQILRTVHFLTVPISLLFILFHVVMGIRAGGLSLTRSMFQP
ncbi:cytochrome b/b6 domain-containing protein [Chamaesiphon minutus]|uniref:Thiosulfate reductase cytochrome B subunit (Membrane anchoring protein) n=1 Tax=Chamaesiphon minutus (strain ATCC 27169 / PCC 6605) TaxID=1173020 RepID=K9UPM6_CHAP6|nr:cytochrome b/b6 domain-containing protein [Chamaesiphon minutus]AFY97042.1 thiosulfate reductase cytochrome B subunit (membrane anchoring protein) [Chamaesiphon minutus PCC 6605]